MRGICDYCKGTEHIKCPFNYEFCQRKEKANEEKAEGFYSTNLLDLGIQPIMNEPKISFGKDFEKALYKWYRKQIKNRRKWG